MKKSNKLLLIGFLTGILLISAIQITLYAKYKSGNYTIYNAEADLAAQPLQTFPNILFVSVRNVPQATVKFSDVAAVEKGQEDDIDYVRKGDTLLISGRDSMQQSNAGGRVTFHLPPTATLSVFHSVLFFGAGKNRTENNPVIYLQKSEALFSGNSGPLQLGQVKLVATDSSTASFIGNTQVNNLDVQLSNSALEYSEGNLGQLSIQTDSLSRISLQSKYLLKTNIKTTVPP